MITTATSEDLVAQGMALFKRVTQRRWLEMPADPAAFDLFYVHGLGEMGYHYKDARKQGYYPHAYDKNKARLGTAAGVNVGTGMFRRIEAPPAGYDRRAGLWHLHIDHIPDNVPEQELPALYDHADGWFWSPTVQLLSELGYAYRIEEAYVFDQQHQVLRPFYEAARGMLEECTTRDETLAVKLMANKTFGMLAHLTPGKEHQRTWLYRPDWYYTLMAQEQANIYRALLKVYRAEGLLPEMVQTDCAWYNHPVSTLPMGTALGQWKYIG